MNIEKIEINGHYVWVDKDAEIKEGDWILNTEREPSIIKCIGKGSLRGWNKIIAASPGLNLEGVPSWEAYLAEQEYPTFNLPLSVTTGIHSIMQEGFIKGYQTAEKELQPEQRIKDLEKRLYDCSKTNADLIGKINELPTWDDVRKAFEAGMQFIGEDKSSWKEFIEQLKTR